MRMHNAKLTFLLRGCFHQIVRPAASPARLSPDMHPYLRAVRKSIKEEIGKPSNEYTKLRLLMVSVGEKESVRAKFQTVVLELPSSSNPEIGGPAIFDGIGKALTKMKKVCADNTKYRKQEVLIYSNMKYRVEGAIGIGLSSLEEHDTDGTWNDQLFLFIV